MKVRAGFGAGFATLLGVSIAAIIQTTAWEESVAWISRTHEIIGTLDGLSLHARDAVEQARLFLVDSDQRHIARTWEELDSARIRGQRLAQQLSDSPSEQFRVSELRRLIDREYEVFSLNSGAATPAAVKAAVDTWERSAMVSEIDAAARAIRGEQFRLLAVHSDDQTEAAKRTRYFFAAISLGACFVMVFAFWRAATDNRRMTAAERALMLRDQQYRQVVDDAGDIIYQTDDRGRFTFCNRTALTTLYLSETELMGRSYLKMIRQDKRRDAERFYLRQFVRKKKHTYYEFPIIDGHGRERWLGQNVQLIFDGGKITGFQSIARDITERKRAEAELEKARNFVERIAATTPGILYVYDLEEKRNLFVNREMYTVLGYREEELNTPSLMEVLIHPDDLGLVSGHHAALRKAGDGEVYRLEYRARHADGRWLWLATRDTPFERGPDGYVKQIVGISQDITQRKSVQEQLEYQANYDALTGLANRHHFFTRLNSVLRRVSIEHSTLSACIMDVDHFKSINDRHGHGAGDEVLQTVGNIIRSEMRGGDIAGRLGGDEFCMILVGADEDEAVAVAERVRTRLTTLAFGLGVGSPFTVTATFGIAETQKDGTSQELLERADAALYMAKNKGRNRISVSAS